MMIVGGDTVTLIEFYDEAPIENIVGCFKMKPEKVIFLGHNLQRANQQEKIYRTLFERHGFQIKIEFVQIDFSTVTQIADVIRSILRENEECVIDCTGGGELELIAVGIVAAEEHRKAPLHIHSTDIVSGRIFDCDNPHCIPQYENAYLSVDDSILLHGGKAQLDLNFHAEDLLAHEADMWGMWDICRENAEQWNTAVSRLHSPNVTRSVIARSTVLKKLVSGGFLKIYTEGNELQIRYKSDLVKRCLKTSGRLLELMVCLLAAKTNRFADIKSDVHIDWEYRDERENVDNEIDVILMRGLCPIYISCKNGRVNDNEIYKLNAVANRFGGKYVKKVLIVTDADRIEGSPRKLISRAQAMGIEVVANFGKKSQKALNNWFSEV